MIDFSGKMDSFKWAILYQYVGSLDLNHFFCLYFDYFQRQGMFSLVDITNSACRLMAGVFWYLRGYRELFTLLKQLDTLIFSDAY